jgi:hypothetical protein
MERAFVIFVLRDVQAPVETWSPLKAGKAIETAIMPPAPMIARA